MQISDFVGAGLRRDIHVMNHALARVKISIEWQLDADFAGYSEAQQGNRQQAAAWERHLTAHGNGGLYGRTFEHVVEMHVREHDVAL